MKFLSFAEIHADTAEALGHSTSEYSLGSLRYDLSKLRAKSLVVRLPKSRRYRLTTDGYRICVVYLKLFEKLYAPLTSSILAPFRSDKRLNGRLSDSTGYMPPFPLLSINWSMLSG